MASLIDIKTDELQQAVAIARQANASLTEAANLLNSVIIHNDWQCPERSEINDNTQRNRTESLRLQADGENFYKTILSVTEDFLAAEQELNRRIDGVDSLISDFLSSVPSSGGGGGHSIGTGKLGPLVRTGIPGLSDLVSQALKSNPSSLVADGGLGLLKKK